MEVELRPAGKKITRLGMLSGGEKALGAISFLFALFLAKPCPFYLLDEVEAALDDANIGRFVELLRRYADRAQFVVITHQKRTMEAADVLYGVTMGGDGISQIVSRRLPREDAAAARGLVELVLRRQALRRLDEPRVDQALAHLVLVDVLEPDQQEGGRAPRSGESAGRRPGSTRRAAAAPPGRSASTSLPRGASRGRRTSSRGPRTTASPTRSSPRSRGARARSRRLAAT